MPPHEPLFRVCYSLTPKPALLGWSMCSWYPKSDKKGLSHPFQWNKNVLEIYSKLHETFSLARFQYLEAIRASFSVDVTNKPNHHNDDQRITTIINLFGLVDRAPKIQGKTICIEGKYIKCAPLRIYSDWHLENECVPKQWGLQSSFAFSRKRVFKNKNTSFI